MISLPSRLTGRRAGQLRALATSLALTLTAVAALNANADADLTGPFVTMSGGLNTLGDATIDATIGGVSGGGETQYSSSYLASFSIGYRFQNGWSVEEEVAFRRVNLSSAQLGAAGNFSDGDFESAQLSAKALYHFPLGNVRGLEAYGGLGLAWLAELDFDVQSNVGEQPFEDDVLGLELHAGFRYNGWKRTFVGGGVRYLWVNDTDLPSPSSDVDVVRSAYDPLSVVVEFGWRF